MEETVINNSQIKELIDLALEFSSVDGISGDEEEVVNLIKDKLKTVKNLSFERDGLGSLAVIKKGKEKAPIISFTTHMDEVGFILTEIDKNGFGKFVSVGGWWGHVILGQRLTLTTSEGRKIIGIVGSKPPHILTGEETRKVLKISELFLDFGVQTADELKAAGVQIGDSIAPYQDKAFVTLNKHRLIGKAWDNRISVIAGIQIMRNLEKIDHDATVIFIGSAQEEVGLRGARTSAFKWTPDIGFAIDVTIANDTPGIPSKPTKLGTGAALSMFDSSTIANKKLFRKLEQIAKDAKIKHTFDGLTGGGTDAGNILLTKEGVLAMTVSIPSRYMHSHNTMIDILDVDATVELIVKFIADFKAADLATMKFS